MDGLGRGRRTNFKNSSNCSWLDRYTVGVLPQLFGMSPALASVSGQTSLGKSSLSTLSVQATTGFKPGIGSARPTEHDRSANVRQAVKELRMVSVLLPQ